MRFSTLLALPILAASAMAQEPAAQTAPPAAPAAPAGEVAGAAPVPGAESSLAVPGAAPTAAPGAPGEVPMNGGMSAVGMAMLPPTSVAGGIQTIIVGGVQQQPGPSGTAAPQLLFQPEQITAQPGEVVRFMFMAMNHSVMQTTFEQPCQAMQGGANSDFMPNKENIIPGPMFDFQVKDTKPVWFSCAQTGHCIKGMVMSINAAPAGDKTHAAYKQLAIKGNAMLKAEGLVADSGVQANQAPNPTFTILQGNGAASPSGSVVNGGGANGVQPNVVGGEGQAANGQTCSCQCLCGQGAFPQNAGQGSFGGFLGEMPGVSQMQAAPAAPAAPGAPARRRHVRH